MIYKTDWMNWYEKSALCQVWKDNQCQSAPDIMDKKDLYKKKIGE